MNRLTRWLVATVLLAWLTGGCRPEGNQEGGRNDDKVIRFITSDGWYSTELIPLLQAEVAKQGFTLKWIVVNDIILPNQLVDEGLADANDFQHEPYFDQFVADHHLTHITRGFYTEFSPSGLYSRKYKSLADVPDGATIGIPVDPANNGRALFMLRDKGLLKIRSGVTVTHASLRDIIDNPHHFKFKEVDQLMLERAFDDVDVGFLFAGIATKDGFDPIKGALAVESAADSPYKGIIAIRKDLVGSPKIKALQKAFESKAIKDFTRRRFGSSIVFLDYLNTDAVVGSK